jgi:predicted metal-dependent peptidase
MTSLTYDRDQRSWARMGRRAPAMGLALPHSSGVAQLGPIGIGVDCSGSIYQRLEILQAFQAEVRGIIEDCAPSEVAVAYFDSQVTGLGIFGVGEPISLKPVGGGGTAYSPAIEVFNKMTTTPEVLIVLTDLICHDYGPPPNYPVLWVVYGAGGIDPRSVPFGEVIMMNEFLA